MSHQNITRVTRSQVRRLLDDLRQVSDSPEGVHLDDSEFAGYSLGLLHREETDRVDRHLASCPDCLDEMERLTIGHHLEDSEFVGYSLGLLPQEETDRVRDHLASCPECAAEMEWLTEQSRSAARLDAKPRPRVLSPTTRAPASANSSVHVQPEGRFGGHEGRLGNAIDATGPIGGTSMPNEPRPYGPIVPAHPSSEAAKTGPEPLPMESLQPRRRLRRRAWIGITCASAAVAVAAAALFFFKRETFAGPEHQVLTTRAWRAYEAEKYDEAIAAASKCVARFRTAARDMQKDLQTKNSPQPPTGRVEPEARDEIHRNGPLNDVATSYWILGRSLEEQGKKTEAIEAFRACAALTYARCWDPVQEIFWDPPKDASGRLEELKSGD
jgi:hypothetical protein